MTCFSHNPRSIVSSKDLRKARRSAARGFSCQPVIVKTRAPGKRKNITPLTVLSPTVSNSNYLNMRPDHRTSDGLISYQELHDHKSVSWRLRGSTPTAVPGYWNAQDTTASICEKPNTIASAVHTTHLLPTRPHNVIMVSPSASTLGIFHGGAPAANAFVIPRYPAASSADSSCVLQDLQVYHQRLLNAQGAFSPLNPQNGRPRAQAFAAAAPSPPHLCYLAQSQQFWTAGSPPADSASLFPGPVAAPRPPASAVVHDTFLSHFRSCGGGYAPAAQPAASHRVGDAWGS